MSRPAKFSPEQMLQAAERVVAREGASKLTFDAVAREANVSKGAVLNYFATKEQLVAAMVERLVERLAPRLIGPADRHSIGELIKSHQTARGDQDRSASALIASIAQDLNVLSPLCEANRMFLEHLASSELSKFDVTLLHFALDGLWLSEVLGISPLSEEERKAFFEQLNNRFGDGALGNRAKAPLPQN